MIINLIVEDLEENLLDREKKTNIVGAMWRKTRFPTDTVNFEQKCLRKITKYKNLE